MAQQQTIDIAKLVKDSNQYLLSANSVLGIAGYDFIATDEVTLNAPSKVTDYQLETGDFLQNYIANKPFTITLTGRISELYFENPNNKSLLTTAAKTTRYAFGVFNTVNMVASSALSTIVSIDNNDTIEDVAGNATNLYAAVSNNLLDTSEVKKAVRFFLSLREAKQTIALTTPFGVFGSMAFEDVTFTMSKKEAGQAVIKIKLKNVNIRKKETSSFSKKTISQAQKYIETEVKQVAEGAKKLFSSASDFLGF